MTSNPITSVLPEVTRMAVRTCLTRGCGQVATYRGRCPCCSAEHERRQARTVPTKAARTTPERKRRAQVVAAHRAQHGDWCPGWNRPPHSATDLVADDVVPVASTGQPSPVLRALCRSCNSRRGARPD